MGFMCELGGSDAASAESGLGNAGRVAVMGGNSSKGLVHILRARDGF